MSGMQMRADMKEDRSRQHYICPFTNNLKASQPAIQRHVTPRRRCLLRAAAAFRGFSLPTRVALRPTLVHEVQASRHVPSTMYPNDDRSPSSCGINDYYCP